MEEKEGTVEEEIIYPDIIFKVKEDLHSISSKHVKTIMQLPEYTAIPNSNPMICGVFMLREMTVPMLDMRKAFGMESVEEECDKFANEFESRKIEYMKWVNELRRCVAANEKFSLSTDPHQCSFGHWHDKYKSSHNMVNSHLKQIDLPHAKLHDAAAKIDEYMQAGNREKAEEVMNMVNEIYAPKMLRLLEEMEVVYRDAYRQMVLVLSDDKNTIGLVVDEVVSVEKLMDVGGEKTVKSFNNTDYITNVKKSSKLDEIIIGLDDAKLLNIAEGFDGSKTLI